MTEHYPEEPELSPLQKLYERAHGLTDQVRAAEHAGDTALAADLERQADQAYREAHDRNPLLRTEAAIPEISE